MGTSNAINLRQPGIAIYNNSSGIFIGLSLTKGQLLTFDGATNQYAVLPAGANGKFLSANSAQDTGLEWTNAPGGGGFTSINKQIFTASGTYTPTSGMKYCFIEAIGGGGAGGGCAATTLGQVAAGGGGQAGNYSIGLFSAATIGASQPIAIGLGGTGVVNNSGNGGGTTSIGAGGSLLQAFGGNGGGRGANGSTTNSQGGIGTVGTFGRGAPGTCGWGSGGVCFSGAGGNSPYGYGGASQVNNGSTVSGDFGICGGGGGGTSNGPATGSAAAGANGGDGIVIITEYI
jgi:hypothetical protein